METNKQFKISVLIVNYNYADYIGEAIQSVLQQSLPVDQLIVVDDGSTDHSRTVIQQALAGQTQAEVIYKENGGQLSAYNIGVPQLNGDIIFFLDSDDRWKIDHIASFMQIFEAHPEVEYVYCGHETFGQSHKSWQAYEHPHYLGMSPLAAIYNRAFYGTSPSASAIRKKMLRQIFPLDNDALLNKKYYADDVIVRGTSILEAVKYFQHPPTTEYRIHSDNEYSGKKRSPLTRYRLLLDTTRLIEHFKRKSQISELCCDDYQKEFITITRPSPKDYHQSLKTLSRLPI
ncbi:glycosyltransferase family 2 protein, partial [Puniceicoccaceae bacterium]|nr:glycosyltransferase family 2 protein [Puniceicoccaceae bacterium]